MKQTPLVFFSSLASSSLLLDRLDELPLAAQVLLPQRNLVVRAADSQHVAAQAPADPPHGRLKVEHLALPLGGAGARRSVRRPDADRLVLRRRGNVRLLENSRRPGDVAHPVRVARQRLALLLVALGRGVKRPNLEHVVAAARDEAAVARGAGARVAADDAAGRRGGGPRHRVDAQAVRGERRVVNGVVLELEHADVTVRRRARQQAASFVGRPGDNVDRSLVQGEVVDALPLVVLCALFLPDEDFAVVAGRGEDVAVLGVCPGDAPDGAFVAVARVVSMWYSQVRKMGG